MENNRTAQPIAPSLLSLTVFDRSGALYPVLVDFDGHVHFAAGPCSREQAFEIVRENDKRTISDAEGAASLARELNDAYDASTDRLMFREEVLQLAE